MCYMQELSRAISESIYNTHKKKVFSQWVILSSGFVQAEDEVMDEEADVASEDDVVDDSTAEKTVRVHTILTM